jgi:hypothetical protein
MTDAAFVSVSGYAKTWTIILIVLFFKSRSFFYPLKNNPTCKGEHCIAKNYHINVERSEPAGLSHLTGGSHSVKIAARKKVRESRNLHSELIADVSFSLD